MVKCSVLAKPLALAPLPPMEIDLETIPWTPTQHAGVWIHFYHRDAETGQATALIKMEPGAEYPTHRHVGAEELLVLQGAYQDERGRHAAGDYVRYEADSSHHPRCPEGATACVLFAVAHRGIDRI